MKTQVCLVSDQPVPNFLPVVNKSTRPEKVVLAVSERMKPKADNIEKVLKNYVRVERLHIPNPYDLVNLQETFFHWLENHKTEEVCLNVTGGTKLMAIAAQERFRDAQKKVFYVSVDTDELFWVGEQPSTIKLEKNIKLDQYLTIHGYTIEESSIQIPDKWKTFSDELFDRAGKWGAALAKLNYHAMEAESRDILDVGYIDSKSTPYWEEMMESLWGNEITCYKDRLKFRNEEARKFANGGWIEHKVFEIVHKLSNVQDVKMNMLIRDSQGNLNELDVAGLYKNSLFIIECKTKRFDKNGDLLHGPAADAIYKLDSLRKTGGLRTRGILVSFMPIDEAYKHRAESYGVTVIDQAGLSRLQELLQKALK